MDKDGIHLSVSYSKTNQSFAWHENNERPRIGGLLNKLS